MARMAGTRVPQLVVHAKKSHIFHININRLLFLYSRYFYDKSCLIIHFLQFVNSELMRQTFGCKFILDFCTEGCTTSS